MKVEYKNRYGDMFTFTRMQDGNILWDGEFEYTRIGMPNDYTKAYNSYLNDNKHIQNLMSFNQFKNAVHEYDDETHTHIYDKYLKMVTSIKEKINMVDPSGGPYITVGMKLDNFGFKDEVVKDIVQEGSGYKLIVTGL